MNFLSNAGFFQAIFDYPFIRYALIAGIIVGILAPLIGTIVVIRRLSFIADTLSHFSLAGVCLGVILSKVIITPFVSPVIMGIIFSISGTFLIEKLRGYYKNYKEISMPIIMSLGLALSGLFINLSPDLTSQQTTSLLYGSIYSVSGVDLALMAGIGVIIIIFALFTYKHIVTLCFDENYARISGINVRLLQLLLTIILALVISLFIDIIGVLLIASLMILPVATAILIGNSFVNTVFISIAFSEVSLISGFVVSYHLDISTGPVIILLNLLIYVIVLLFRGIKRSHYQKEIQI